MYRGAEPVTTRGGGLNAAGTGLPPAVASRARCGEWLTLRRDGLFVFFICGFWSHCGLKRPLLADLVAPSDQGRALAVNCVIDAFGFMAGASLAGYLAEERYNYPRTNLDAEPNGARASALGNAIVACSIAPSLLSFCSASALHWTVESDMRNAGKDRRVDDDGETQQL